MEIRCSKCEHLGTADEVRAMESGVGLVCASCGHVNIVSATSDDAGSQAIDGSLSSEPGDDISIEQFEVDADAKEEWKLDHAVERLVPEPGDGPRCRKCAHRFEEPVDHCAHCGLSVAEAANYEPGQAPWEQVAPSKEEALQKARKRWGYVGDQSREESIEDYVDFVIEEELIDHGIRTLQFHLVEQPDDEEALAGLARLAKSLEVAVRIARTRAESKAEKFQEDVKQMRSRLLYGALLFWTVILLFFLWLFWDKF